jgi:antitoxin component YwqK of YwqJK toxin-antitoxin module
MMGEEGDTIFAEYLIDKKNLINNNYSRYDNGQLEYVGKTCYSLETGYMHLGVWKYYNEEGEIIETKKYPTFEKLESDK